MALAKWINFTAGVPIVSDFITTNGQGSPLIVNLATAGLYFLTAAGVVTPIAGAAGSGSITASGYVTSTATILYRKTAGTGAIEEQTLATLKTDLGLTGTNSGDQTITLTGNVTGSGTGSFATTIAAAAVTLAMQANMATASIVYRKTAGAGAPEVQTLATLQTDLGLAGTNSGNSYKTVFQAGGSHTAAQVAGTYGLPSGNSAIVVSGVGSVYPLEVFRLEVADFPTVNGVAPKLRVRANLHCNDVAPTGNFTFGLYPVTRPGTSGGVGVCIYTIGALVTGSGATAISAPAADSSNTTNGSDFAFPADGYYVLAVVASATIAASAHLHMNAFLQQRNA